MGIEISFPGLVKHEDKDKMRKSIDVVQTRFVGLEHFDLTVDIIESVRVIPCLSRDILPIFKGGMNNPYGFKIDLFGCHRF